MTSKFQMAVAAALAGLMAASAGPALAGFIPGKGNAKSECYAGLDVENVLAGGSNVSKGNTITCNEGNPCDTGACGDGVCTFRVAACINQPGVSGCTPPSGLEKLQVKGKANIEIPQLLEGSACGSFLEVPVQLKKNGKKPGKAKFTVIAKAPKETKPRKEKDVFTFICQPRPADSPCPPPNPLQGTLDFVVQSSTEQCGRVTDAASLVIGTLVCGGLNLGGGIAAAPPEGPTPNGSTNRFGLKNCSGDVCTIVPTTQAQAPAGLSCTDTDCPFGLPLPILGNPATCVLNSLAAPVSGTFDLATGSTTDLSVSLSSNIFLSGTVYQVKVNGQEVGQPCPVCVNNLTDLVPQAGTPSSPASGVCNGGARATEACTTPNSNGLSLDCLPGGSSNTANPSCSPTVSGGSCTDSLGNTVANLGDIAVDLTPLKTAAVSKTAADGLFCPSQADAGCFNSELTSQGASGAACRGIFADGRPFGDLRSGTPGTGVLASVFCIPATSSPIVNASANLPGPGETTLPGTLKYTPVTQ